jgi:hypothetical protein
MVYFNFALKNMIFIVLCLLLIIFIQRHSVFYVCPVLSRKAPTNEFQLSNFYFPSFSNVLKTKDMHMSQ